jgi:hypothetical protein
VHRNDHGTCWDESLVVCPPAAGAGTRPNVECSIDCRLGCAVDKHRARHSAISDRGSPGSSGSVRCRWR